MNFFENKKFEARKYKDFIAMDSSSLNHVSTPKR